MVGQSVESGFQTDEINEFSMIDWDQALEMVNYHDLQPTPSIEPPPVDESRNFLAFSAGFSAGFSSGDAEECKLQDGPPISYSKTPRHVNTKAESKKYYCHIPRCSRSNHGYTRKDGLTQHLRHYHHIVSDLKTSKPSSPGFHKHCIYIGCSLYRTAEEANLMPHGDTLFPTRSSFTKHIREAHDQSIYPCSIPGCDKIGRKGFFRERDLMKHMEVKHNIDRSPEEDIFATRWFDSDDIPGITYSTPLPNENYDDSEVSFDEEDDLTQDGLEEEFADILDIDIEHAYNLIDKVLSRYPCPAILQCETSFRHCGSGSVNAPGASSSPSSSSETANNDASPNTEASGTSGGKRKSLGGGGGGDGGDGGDKDKPPKRARPQNSNKKSEPRYDCPIDKRVFRIGDGTESPASRGCAQTGLEFRNLWVHIIKQHLGCNICGKRITKEDEIMDHIYESRECLEKTSTYDKSLQQTPHFDIGIPAIMSMRTIYKNRDLSNDQKWTSWWKLLHPDADEADTPNPRHQGRISISTADIPAILEILMDKLTQDIHAHGIDPFNDDQFEIIAKSLDKTRRSLPPLHRIRQRTRPKVQLNHSPPETSQEGFHASGPSQPTVNNWQELGHHNVGDPGLPLSDTQFEELFTSIVNHQDLQNEESRMD